MNTKSAPKVGRPAAELKYPRGVFTLNQLVDLNPGVCRLTCIKHVATELDSNFLTLLKEPVRTGKVGKPALRYIRTAIKNGLNRAKKTRKNQTPTEAGTPNVGTPAEVLMETVAALATPAPETTTEVPVVEQTVAVNASPAETPTPTVESAVQTS
jgi:hypothetical protein